MHRRWMAGLRFEQAAHHIVLEDCIAAVETATARRDRLESSYRAALPDWSLAPVVRALQALRGMALVAAATIAEPAATSTRFANPRQLMAYLGLVPSEHSAAPHDAGRHHESGNGAARRMLIEAAWSYRFPARGISREQLRLRQEGLAKPIRDTAWKPRSGCVGAIIALAGRENHLQYQPRLLENWRALPGRSPSTFRILKPLDALIDSEHHEKEVIADAHLAKLSKAGGTVTATGELASTISRIFSDAGAGQESSATHHRSGGIQPAHQSMIGKSF